jgi:hypothetical protein
MTTKLEETLVIILGALYLKLNWVRDKPYYVPEIKFVICTKDENDARYVKHFQKVVQIFVEDVSSRFYKIVVVN